MSHLSRLFHFAKATGAAAIENFATEALAAAIRADVAPLVAALELVGIQLQGATPDVQTQVPVDGVGILDLLITPNTGCPVVIEVKIHANESGNQIQRYREWLETLPVERRPSLVTLCRSRLTQAPEVTWLPWQVLRRQALGRDARGYWRDFAQFLRENEMADDSDEPTTATEARTLVQAHELLRKAVQILKAPAHAANELWPGSNWPAQENRIRNMIASRFAKWPSYTIQHKARFRAGLTMGIYHETETSDAWLGVWVWAKPNYVQERSRIADQTQGLQGSPWYREGGTWNPIGAYARLLDFSDHEQASAWLTARLHDLASVGLLDLLPRLGAPPPEDEVDAEDE